MTQAQRAALEVAVAKHDPIHVVVYGYSGTKKTTFGASFPTPQYWVFFDGRSKAAPIRRIGDRIEMAESELGTPIERVYKGKKLMAEIWHYQDYDPEKPDAYSRFRREIRDFDDRAWATFGFDSTTSAALSAYLEQRFTINKAKVEDGQFDDKKSLKWNSGVTDQLAFQICRRFVGFECNVVLICHIEEKYTTTPTKEGPKRVEKRVESGEEDEEGVVQISRTLSAPGRLSKRGLIVSQFAETYRSYVEVRDGKRRWRLQTEKDEEYIAGTQIPAPDGCAPEYEALWK